MQEALKIGQLSKATGCQVETIRFYEQQGLLPMPARNAGNYRQYDAAHVERLLFIRHCRSLDMPLNDVRVLLDLRDAPDESCSEANALLDQRIEQVAQRIAELNSLQTQLSDLRSRCQSDNSARDCGILQGLSAGTCKVSGCPVLVQSELHISNQEDVERSQINSSRGSK